jgi:hypothetical protein
LISIRFLQVTGEAAGSGPANRQRINLLHRVAHTP